MDEILKRYRRAVYEFPGASTYVEYLPREDNEESEGAPPLPGVNPWQTLTNIAIQAFAMVGFLHR